MLKLVLIFGALAEFERNLIRERTQAGLVAARARGRKGGRPKALTYQRRSIAQELYDTGHPIMDICRTLKISRATCTGLSRPEKEINYFGPADTYLRGSMGNG
jgi:DNA invertase Pin-like site-specific DNA recombinase